MCTFLFGAGRLVLLAPPINFKDHADLRYTVGAQQSDQVSWRGKMNYKPVAMQVYTFVWYWEISTTNATYCN